MCGQRHYLKIHIFLLNIIYKLFDRGWFWGLGVMIGEKLGRFFLSTKKKKNQQNDDKKQYYNINLICTKTSVCRSACTAALRRPAHRAARQLLHIGRVARVARTMGGGWRVFYILGWMYTMWTNTVVDGNCRGRRTWFVFRSFLLLFVLYIGTSYYIQTHARRVYAARS